MSAETIRAELGGSFIRRSDGWWLAIPIERIGEVAQAMREGGARFATLVAMPAGAAMLRLTWHWDVGGILMSVETNIHSGMPVPSIVGIYPGADWAEREARDYYALNFEGRDSTPPLMLRETDSPGILLHSQRRNV